MGRGRDRRPNEATGLMFEVVNKIDSSGLSHKEIEQLSGVCSSSLSSWRVGKDRVPNIFAVEYVLVALGYKLVIVPNTEKDLSK